MNVISSSFSATGEIIARLSKAMNIVPDAEIASALYGAILTDTGGFMFSNTTEETHKIAGKLISLGASFYNLNKKLMLEKIIFSPNFKKIAVSLFCTGDLL